MSKETWSSLELFCLPQKGKLQQTLGSRSDYNVTLTLNNSYKISTRKKLKIVTKQRKPGELTIPQQEERARHLHHNYKNQ